MSKELGEIPFGTLADYDDSDYLVFTALTLTDTETIDEIEDFLSRKDLSKIRKSSECIAFLEISWEMKAVPIG